MQYYYTLNQTPLLSKRAPSNEWTVQSDSLPTSTIARILQYYGKLEGLTASDGLLYGPSPLKEGGFFVAELDGRRWFDTSIEPDIPDPSALVRAFEGPIDRLVSSTMVVMINSVIKLAYGEDVHGNQWLVPYYIADIRDRIKTVAMLN